MAERRAVVIGVNEYKDSEIPKLTGAVNDAIELCEKLKASGDFEIADEHFLVNEKATCTAIRKAISDLLWICDIYSGEQWAEKHVSLETKKNWQPKTS